MMNSKESKYTTNVALKTSTFTHDELEKSIRFTYENLLLTYEKKVSQ